MSNGRALDRHDDDARRGPPGWPQQGQGRGPFAAQSPSGYGEGRTSRGSPQGQWDVNRAPRRQEGGHGRREEQGYRQDGRPRSAELPQFRPEHQPGAQSEWYARDDLANWGDPAGPAEGARSAQDAYSEFGGYGGYGGQGQDRQQSQRYQHHYPPLGGQGHEGQHRLGNFGYQQQHQTQQQQEADQRQRLQSMQRQMAQNGAQHRAEMVAARREGDVEMAAPSGHGCGARLSEVSASTAKPDRVPNQHPEGGSQSTYSDPTSARKVTITAAQLADESTKPVLQEGEALSEAREFPLWTDLGSITGLDTEVIWLLHYWVQGHQGVMLEFGCPDNKIAFTPGEVYHSLSALLTRKGYDPKYVMSTDMPTGNRTGPWKTSIAGKVALDLALEGMLTVFPTDDGDREPLELTVHILSNNGNQIHAERVRRPPLSEQEKEEKRRHRVVIYADHPAEMHNLRSDVYASRMAVFKSTATAHFMKKGAVHVGCCQARDKEGCGLNRTILFIQIPPDGPSPKEFATAALPGTKYIDIKCHYPAKLKLARTGDHGLRNCCFREKCTPGIGLNGATACDAGNYYMDSDGEQQQSAIYHRAVAMMSRGAKRALDTDKEEVRAKSAEAIKNLSDIHAAVQVCRAFERGRCVKYHDAQLPVGDPRRCSEEHDKPKSEIKCCSTHVPGDKYYNRHFTKCRYKLIGETCQYMCNNETLM